ncbi:hypothetical protein HY26_16700 [Hyphomonas sp. GM-8P]|nr:hypothetical protein HY26_16700 [Hyphomonas sp. GM-8P]
MLSSLLGGGLTIACILYFSFELHREFSSDNLNYNIPTTAVMLSGSAYLASYFCFAASWQLLLKALHVTVPIRSNLGIHAVTQFAKYLPGNVAHHIGRLGLTAREGAPAGTVAAAMTLEILMVIGIMSLIGLPLIPQWLHMLSERSDAAWIVVASALVACLIGSAMLYAYRWHPRVAGLRRHIGAQLPSVDTWNWQLVIMIAVLMGVGANFAGATLVALDTTSMLGSIQGYAYTISLYAVAFLLGFLMPGAPAGLGIRDMILLEGLSPLLGRDTSLQITLYARLISATCDLLVFILGIALLRGRARTRPQINRDN